MLSYFWALIGMFCWGIGPVFAKLGLKSVSPLLGLWVRTMAAGVIVSAWFSLSSRPSYFSVLSLKGMILLLIEAIFTTVVGDLAYYAAIKRGPCGEISVILSAAPAVTIFLSFLFLGEKPTPWGLVGVLLITLGLVLVGVQPR